MATKNLGQVSAVIKSVSQPTNTNIIWQDSSVTPNLFKSYDSTQLAWRPVGDYTLEGRSLTINGTTNEVTVSGGTQDLSEDRTWTVGLPSDVIISNDLTVSNDAEITGSLIVSTDADITGSLTVSTDVTITGDLTVNGTNTSVNTANLTIEDPLIHGADGNTNDTLDLGAYWSYNGSSTEAFTGIYRDTSRADKAYVFFDGLQVQPTTTVNTGGAGFSLSNIVISDPTLDEHAATKLYVDTEIASNVTGQVTSSSVGSVTDNAIARWDTTSGTVIQGSTVTIDDSGNINANAILVNTLASNNVTSGTWSPTFTSVSNLDSTPTLIGSATYARVDNEVFCKLGISVNATSVGEIQFRISLPINSNFTSVYDAQGVATGNVPDYSINASNNVTANIASDHVLVVFGAGSSSTMGMGVSFQYTINAG